VISIADVAMAGMQLDEAVSGDDRLVVIAGLVKGINPHQLAFGGPYRIGMLAFDLLERLGGVGKTLVDERIHRLVVKVVDRLLDVDFVLRIAAPGKHDQQHGDSEPRRRQQQRHLELDPRALPHAGYSTESGADRKPAEPVLLRRWRSGGAPVSRSGRAWPVRRASSRTRRRHRQIAPPAGAACGYG